MKPSKAKKTKSSIPKAVVAKAAAPNNAGFKLRDLGAALGSTLGPVGSMIGGLGGDLISHVTGFGDYEISSNSLTQGRAVPTFKNDSDGLVVCHREYITDVSGHGTTAGFWNDYTLYLNPGMSSTFPFLSQIAANFEQWEPLGMIFEFRPTSGFATGSNTALGAVVMATNYDVNDAAFPDKPSMESYFLSASGVPSSQIMHAIECDPEQRLMKILQVRTGTLPATAGGSSLLNYDLGLTQIATSNAPNNVLGELWVTYEIRFRKPKLNPGRANAAHFISVAGASTSGSRFGTSTQDDSRCVLYNNVPNCHINPWNGVGTTDLYLGTVGYYVVQLVVTASSATVIPTAGGVVGTNILNTESWLNYTTQTIPTYQSSAQVANNQILATYMFHVKAPGNYGVISTVNTVTFSGGTWSGGNLDMYVTYVGPNPA